MPPANKFRFLVDEDLHIDVAHFLKKEGHNVTIVPKGIKNGSVFRLAVSGRRTLLSADKDFLNSDLFPPAETRGVIVVRIHPLDPSLILPVLKEFLLEFSPKWARGNLFSLEPAGVVKL